MNNLWHNQHCISIDDLSLQQIEQVINLAQQFKSQPKLAPVLDNKLIAHCFFEPSTRTRLSFEAATLRLGGKIIGFSSGESLSIQKGETLADTLRMLDAYADLIILRHPKEGSARLATTLVTKSVINAGDGANQHPTQTLVDLFTIQACQKNLHGLVLALVGDLKYGRTIHSLIQAAILYKMRLFLVSPPELSLPDTSCNILKKAGVRFSIHQSLQEIINKADILYMTRIQQERFQNIASMQLGKDFRLTTDLLKTAQPHLKILHPLPRNNEIDPEVDQTSHAYYFEQAANGVYVRQALLALIIGSKGL